MAMNNSGAMNNSEAMNPSTAFATALVDELVRCGLREAVIAPGSRSAPLAMALHAAASGPGSELRLHVRIDERSASFLALGLAKASGRPVAVVCTSGTAAAHFHAAVIEADESGVPLIVLTADRPPELRGTGANQTIDQVKLYGSAVRWFCEVGVPENRPGQAAYWRSLACRAWSSANGNGAAVAGPVHLNLPLREPLVPGLADPAGARWRRSGASRWRAGQTVRRGRSSLPIRAAMSGLAPALTVDWTERGVVVAGDGTANPAGVAELAARAGWPLLAEPSSGARQGPTALRSYQYLLDAQGFISTHRPDLIVSAGRPGLSRGQLALLQAAGSAGRHIVLSQGGGRWSDPARTASDVAGSLIVRGLPGELRRTAELGHQRNRAPLAGCAHGRRPTPRRCRRPTRYSRRPAVSASHCWRARSVRRCRPARCYGWRPACRPGTWTGTWSPGQMCGCWPAGARAVSTGWCPRLSAQRWRTRLTAAALRPRCSATWPWSTMRQG